jgi:nifR3 family TIM-barrel protein
VSSVFPSRVSEKPTSPQAGSTAIDYRPLVIGDLEIGFPIVQAALSGYSDWPMRMLAREHGASYTLCEVMLDQFLVGLKDRSKTQHYLHLSESERPVAGQLMGAEPEQFAAGAVKLVEAGFDVIDINFGCPVRKVLGRCRGGFHLSQPDVALEIVRRTREKVPNAIPVTVKMRRGIDDTDEARKQFFDILSGAFEIGVAAITVHGRTVEQRYNGPSRWEFLKEVKEFVGDKIILGSGDLFSAEDCWRMMAETGVDGVTVARGAIGNPWIFEQAQALADGKDLPPPPTLFRQRAVIERHWALALELYGAQRASPPMRKFGIKYSASHPQHIELRSEFAKTKSLADLHVVLDRWYSEDLPGVYPSGDQHRAQGSGCHTTAADKIAADKISG